MQIYVIIMQRLYNAFLVMVCRSFNMGVRIRLILDTIDKRDKFLRIEYHWVTDA